jgi:hypothetical protein
LRFSLVLVAFAAVSLSASYAQNSAVNFIAAELVPLASACNNVFAGRFHKSASMDLMTTCSPTYPPSAVPNNTAMLNQGNGTYTPVEDTAIDQLAVPVAVADMNGDGLTGLVLNQLYSPTMAMALSRHPFITAKAAATFSTLEPGLSHHQRIEHQPSGQPGGGGL